MFNGANNPYGDIPGRDVFLEGPLPDDRRHDIKASATWAATRWLSMGMRYNYASGFPYNRLYRNEVTGNYENYRALRGINPGTNINDPNDDRDLRYPDTQELNVQVRFAWLPLTGHQLDFYVDALNILNLRTATAYGQNEGQNFGVETGWMAPFRMRLGDQLPVLAARRATVRTYGNRVWQGDGKTYGPTRRRGATRPPTPPATSRCRTSD